VKLGEGVEWALHCATLLASLPPETSLSGKALAEFHGVSESYLLKHLKAATAAGLFNSTPGPRGGFCLARPARDVSLLDVVLAVEGAAAAFRCAEVRQRGPAAAPREQCLAPCAINAAMLRAEQAWRASLAETSLQTIVDRMLSGLTRERAERAMIWLRDNARSRRPEATSARRGD
jgi:Rrf2 family protein